MSRYVLVGCGSSKRAEKTEARHLYTSTYFEKKRQFAEQCAQWWVLSAEHGAISPSKVIEPYETHIDDVDADRWATDVRLSLRSDDSKWIDDDSELIVLAGQKYIEPIQDVLDELEDRPMFGVTVRYPFDDTSGIGEQLSLLDDLTEAERSNDDPQDSTQTAQQKLFTDGGERLGDEEKQIGADHSAGDFWEGPHGYLKKLEDGRVIPVPQRECGYCGFLGTATGELPRYNCENEDCRVIAFA